MPAFLIKSNQQFDISRNSFDKYLANLAITFKNAIIKPDWMNCRARGLWYNSRARREMIPIWTRVRPTEKCGGNITKCENHFTLSNRIWETFSWIKHVVKVLK